MKKTLTATASLIATLALTACSSSDNSSAVTSERDLEANYTNYETFEDIRNVLASTDYECTDWRDSDTSDEGGACSMEDRGIHPVIFTEEDEDLGLFANIAFDEFPAANSIILGDNWIFGCMDSLPLGHCQEIANELGGGRVARSLKENDFEMPVLERGATLNYTCEQDRPCDFPIQIESLSPTDECTPGSELEGDNTISGETQLIEMSGTLTANEWQSRLVRANPAAWFWMEDSEGGLHRLSDMRYCDSTEQSWTGLSFADTTDTRTTTFEIPSGIDRLYLDGDQESLILID